MRRVGDPGNLKSKGELLLQMDHAFGWTFNPRTFGECVRIDPRLKDGPVGCCAVENDSVVGFVSVLDLPTRTWPRLLLATPTQSSVILASCLLVSISAIVDLPLRYPQTSPGLTTNVLPFR